MISEGLVLEQLLAWSPSTLPPLFPSRRSGVAHTELGEEVPLPQPSNADYTLDTKIHSLYQAMFD